MLKYSVRWMSTNISSLHNYLPLLPLPWGHLCLPTPPSTDICHIANRLCCIVRMFDRIDQPSQVPRYPTNRAPLPRPESTSFSVRYSSDAGPVYSSTLEMQPPPQLPPALTFTTHSRSSYWKGPVNDCGKRGVPISSTSHAYPRVAALASGHVEGRRSIHPYDHNGTGGWQATSVLNSGMSDDVEVPAKPLPHRLSPRPHPSEVSANPTVYAEERSEIDHGGGARIGNPWSKRYPGKWKTGSGTSATAAAAVLGSATSRGGRGQAWDGGGGGAWT